MYASGNHIGIEWGSTALTGTTDFGWGIAHEIGHDIITKSFMMIEQLHCIFHSL